jgi:hypothetical protein
MVALPQLAVQRPPASRSWMTATPGQWSGVPQTAETAWQRNFTTGATKRSTPFTSAWRLGTILATCQRFAFRGGNRDDVRPGKKMPSRMERSRTAKSGDGRLYAIGFRGIGCQPSLALAGKQ